MKKIYKVYAQNCVRPNGMSIIEINENKLREEIENAASEYFNIANTEYLSDEEGDIAEVTFDTAWRALVSLLEADWKKYKALEFGDYVIKESGEEPNRPNMCGFSFNDYTEADILKAMKEV